jgi:hypothetical protein
MIKPYESKQLVQRQMEGQRTVVQQTAERLMGVPGSHPHPILLSRSPNRHLEIALGEFSSSTNAFDILS